MTVDATGRAHALRSGLQTNVVRLDPSVYRPEPRPSVTQRLGVLLGRLADPRITLGLLVVAIVALGLGIHASPAKLR